VTEPTSAVTGTTISVTEPTSAVTGTTISVTELQETPPVREKPGAS
jgi:hypothetical protein